MSPSGKARDFDSRIRRFKSGHPSQKSESLGFRIFHLCRRHNIIWPKVNIISSIARTSLPRQAAQMNDVEALPQMKWAYAQWCDASHQWCCASRKRTRLTEWFASKLLALPAILWYNEDRKAVLLCTTLSLLPLKNWMASIWNPTWSDFTTTI